MRMVALIGKNKKGIKKQNSSKNPIPPAAQPKQDRSGTNGKQKDRNRELVLVTYIFTGLFLMLMGYFIYFNWFQSSDVINSPYNARQDTFSDRIVRGSILSDDGDVLAETLTDSDGKETRNYPYGEIFSHIAGYSTKGKSGIESLANFSLLRSNSFILERIANEIKGEKNIGDNVVTTLDTELQQAAWNALGGYDGAVIVMEPDTGKILAMVSKPDFDPNRINELWDTLQTDEDGSVLLNRATQGLYPPGSIYKILTTLEYIRENPDYEAYSFDCSGSLTVEGSRINCYHNKAHGLEDLTAAFSNSCNSAYADLGLLLDKKMFVKLCNSFLFNDTLPYELPFSKSSFVLSADASVEETMQTAIGQGETLVSPLHMALITSAVANDGILMKPFLIDRIENYAGDLVKQYAPAKEKQLMTPEEAGIMTGMMQSVVTSGTGIKLNGLSYTVAGKTGSAEYSNEKGESHAWFVGFSSVENPEIVVSIIVEGAGAGSEYAVPIARKILDAYYN